jgi:hypothetical protein
VIRLLSNRGMEIGYYFAIKKGLVGVLDADCLQLDKNVFNYYVMVAHLFHPFFVYQGINAKIITVRAKWFGNLRKRHTISGISPFAIIRCVRAPGDDGVHIYFKDDPQRTGRFRLSSSGKASKAVRSHRSGVQEARGRTTLR